MGGGKLWGDEKLPKKFLDQLKKQGTKGREQLAPQDNKRIARQEQRKYEKMLNRRDGKK
jgi:hypothetical protein